MVWILAMLLCILTIISYKFSKREICNPAVLFISPFFLMSIIGIINKEKWELNDMKLLTTMVLVLGTLAFSNVPLVKGTAVTISTYILTYFTPTQAMFFTWLLSVLCGGILGLIIYGCNVISKSKVVGIVASGFLVILSAAVSGNEMAQWFSPVSWTTLNKLDVGKLTQYPTFTYVMVVYMTAIIILSVWIIKVIEKKDVGVMIREV